MYKKLCQAVRRYAPRFLVERKKRERVVTGNICLSPTGAKVNAAHTL